MSDETIAELKAAILNVHEAMLFGFERHNRMFVEMRHDMNRRFDRVDERFDRMDLRFDRMDLRFDRMDERFDRLEVRVDAIEPRGHSPAS